jgi:hypothetical protein
MKAERVVEILCDGESAGSGYLLTHRHVVTAEHVARTARKRAVWPLEDPTLPPGAPRPAALPAQLAWKGLRSRDKNAQAPDIDIAILELVGQGVGYLPPDPIPFGFVPRGDLDPRPFACTGFPAAAGAASSTVYGQLTYVPNYYRFDVNVHSAIATELEDWGGLSGALLFCAGSAIAVVHTAEGRYRGKLTATPLDLLLSHDPFLEYWRKQNIALPGKVEVDTNLAERVHALRYLLDRKNETKDVKDRILQTSTGLAQVIVIHGLDEDELCHMMSQLSANGELARFFERDVGVDKAIPELPWPSDIRQVDPDDAWPSLIAPFYSAVNVEQPPRGAPPTFAAIRRNLDTKTTPRAFFTLVRKRNAFGGHGRLLRKLLDFWDALGDGLPVFLFLTLALDDAEIPPAPKPSLWKVPTKQWVPEIELEHELQAGQDRLAGRWAVFGPLGQIAPEHIDSWTKDLRFQPNLSLSSSWLNLLGSKLQYRVGAGMRARRVGAELAMLLPQL